MVILKTLTGTLAANVNEITFTDAIIDSNSIIEVYYNSNDVYTVETWQRDTTIGIVTSDHDFPVGVKVLINNVVAFSPYDDTDLVNRISGDEDNITALDGRLDTAEDDITSLDGRLDVVEETLPNKQDTLTAGDNITIENNVISANSGDNYSTTEKVIGTWIDGKPLYRQTITSLSLQLNGTNWVNYTAVSNIKKLISLDAYYEVTDGRLLHCSIAEYQSLSNGGFQLCATSATFNRTINILTIEYTKTTD